MANVHYFQRYSQKENVVTNNTLLLLSRIYHYSPATYENLLNSTLDDVDLTVGPSFSQQEGGRNQDGTGSIPDGTISQASFRVVIETKLHGDAYASQLVRHLDRFQNADTQVLLLVDKDEPSDGLIQDVKEAITEHDEETARQVIFRTTTFSELIDATREEIPPHAAEIVDMIGDYEDFCTGLGLIPSAPYKMRVVPCGDTLEENIEHGVYYHPASRSYSSLGCLGLYKQKSVRAVGKPIKTVQARLGENRMAEIIDFDKEPTEEEIQRIEAAAIDGYESRGYDLNEDRLYFLVDKFYRTDEDGTGFSKESPYGLPGEKHFDLRDVLETEDLPDPAEVARLLAERTWT